MSWIVLILMAPGMALIVWIVIQAFFRAGGVARGATWAAEGKCAHCGHDLRTNPAPSADECPGCHQPIALRFRLLHAGDLRTFDGAYRVYHESIDPAVQKTWPQILQMLARDDYRFIIVSRQNVVIGCSILFVSLAAGFSVLEYLAIAAASRGAGLGSRLFDESARVAASALAQPSPMLIEVDPIETPASPAQSPSPATAPSPAPAASPAQSPSPATAPSPAPAASPTTSPSPAPAASPAAPIGDRTLDPHAINARRQAFYRGLGCRRIAGLKYILPLNADAPPHIMDLFAYQPPAQVTRDDLARWLNIIYTRIYALPRGDPRIAIMMRDIEDVVQWD